MSEKLRIIVGGLVGQFPLGGVAWDYFHYVLGLSELGHDVVYHEDTWVWPFHPVKRYPTDDPDYTVRFIRDFFADYAPHLSDRWHYVLLHEKHFGMTGEAFSEFAKTADIFLNVSGACFFPDDLSPRAVKVFLDTDPGYNQIMLAERHPWSEHIERWCSQVAAHDRHLTYAENIYADDCLVPRMKFDWRTTRCVVTLPDWKSLRDNPAPASAPFTTVMTWDYFRGRLTHGGREFFTKVPEFEKFQDLPQRTGHPLAVAIGGHKTPADHIRSLGWQMKDAHTETITPASYQKFIGESRGEWSIAKNVYVDTRSGWFSCRTACYLAAGRPAVVQDTAWSRYVPSGRGVLAFATYDECLAALDEVAGNYAAHAAAAFEIARDYLAPDRVLPRMIDDILRAPRFMKPLHIIFGGYIVAFPLGGMTWHHLNYLLGLQSLGHKITFLEDSGEFSYPYDPSNYTTSADSTYGRAYLEATFAHYGLDARYCYYSQFEDRYYGLSREELFADLRSADLLLCVSGVTPRRPEWPTPRRTVAIDTDPVFTQLRMLKDEHFANYWRSFDRVASFATMLGTAACELPTLGLDWIPTRQAVALDHWPVLPPPAAPPALFTTVGKWEHTAERHVEFNGRRFLSSKGVEWMKLLDLPRHVPVPLAMGMDAMPGDTRRQFESHGWRLFSAGEATATCDGYQKFIAESAGELSVAKEIYSGLKSGWFSDRSSCYLASGRPVVVQSSGFETWMPTGEGLFSFSNPDEAAAALRAISADPARHSAAARRLAEKHLDAKKVLAELLERVMA